MFRRLILTVETSTNEVLIEDATTGRRVPDTTEEFHERTVPYIRIPNPNTNPCPVTTLNNICQHLFGKGITMQSTADPADPSHGFQAAALLSSFYGETTQLGYGRGPSKELAKYGAARAAIKYLQHAYPDQIELSA